VSARLHAVTIDCQDARRLADFWARALGGSVREAGNGYVAVDHGPDGSAILLFQPVPEGRVGKNRLHCDLVADDRDAEMSRLVELGATPVEERSDSLFTWWVLTDPEGNVFCLG
jgi:catechol 2,3-dioxygenase-like lactoylglutathione lyase family enzyme